MAFWSMTSSLSMAGATEKMLDRGSFTLAELLDCDDILNQVLAPNDRVIKYLCQSEIIRELVGFALASPDPPKADKEEPEEDEKESLKDTEKTADEAGEKKEVPAEEVPAEEKDTKQEEESPVASPQTSPNTEAFEYREYQEGDTSDTDSEFEDEKLEEEKLKRVRFAKISAEILTTDIWTLLDALLSNEEAMHELWSLLDPEKPEATTQQLALFTKIIEGLLEKRLDRMLEFIRTLPHFVDYFIRYIECQPLVDFLIKVISTDHPESPNDVIGVLYDQDLIPKMISLLGPDVPHSAQSAAGDFLKAFVNISGGNKSDICAIGPNELSRQFVGQACMQQLIDLMLCGGHGMCVAVTVIIEVIRKNNSDYDFVDVLDTTLATHPPDPRDNIYLGTMVKLFARAIPKFQAMLTAPENRVMKMPFGEIKPLGFERFRICELYAELLHCSNMNLLNDPRGEAVVRERDLERVRVFFPDRLAQMNEEATAEQKEGKARDENDEHAEDEHAEDKHTADEHAEDEHAEDKHTEDDADIGEEKDKEENAVPTSPSATPPIPEDVATPRASKDSPESPETPPRPKQGSDPPLESPSPATPEHESVDCIENDDQQKLNITGLRGEQLAESLERENKKLREEMVVGDQLKIALDDNECIDTVVKLLFEFPWNNFLHNVVFDIVQQVFNGYIDRTYNKFLAINLFERARITEQIVSGQRANDEYEEQRHIRLGYVGHLTLISEEVVKFESLFVTDSISPNVSELLSEPEWDKYVRNDLLQLREQYNTVLGRAGSLSDEESFEIQDDDEGRVRAIELNLIDDDDDDEDDDETGFNNLRRARAGESESESESESDTDSDADDQDEMLALVPQRSHDNDEPGAFELEDERVLEETGVPPRPSAAELSAEKAAVREAGKTKKAEVGGEFSRYMSEHLQGSNKYDSGSSDDDDDDDDHDSRIQ